MGSFTQHSRSQKIVVSSVASELHNLIDTIQDNLIPFLDFEEEEVKHIQDLHAKHEGAIMKYEKGISGISYRVSYYTKQDFIWTKPEKYIQRLSKNFKVVNRLKKKIEDNYKLSKDDVVRRRTHLIHYITSYQNKPLPGEHISEIITVFINDLNSIPPDWRIKLWISGIYLDMESIIINPDFQFRKPTNPDMTFEFSVSGTPGRAANQMPDTCDSIIEMQVKNKNNDQVNAYLDKIIRCLRLFRLGAVNITYREYEPNSFRTFLKIPGPNS